ncbi:MAG: response regulator [Desulfotignum sp.]|nr:response regulator [Desulfotignum sp.]MCF8126177.1 response regulator [Desulfotignum sp.]
MEETVPKTILLVEDEPQNLKLFRDILQFRGYTTIEATDGQQGVDMAKKYLPDLVLMDIKLPVMDGIAATKILKQNEATKDIIIVALTADAMPGDKEKILAAGCHDYISKPFRLHVFIEKINEYLAGD